MPSADEIIVVGSGPAGVAAASALAARGRRVRIVDAGRTAPPGVRRLVEPLAASEPEDWPDGAADALRRASHAATRAQAEVAGEDAGVDAVNRTIKPAFGSLYPYAVEEPALPRRLDARTSMYPSLVRGGLSTSWGAAVLPFADDDLAGWPISATDLAEHYRAVLRYVPLAGARDALEAVAPLYLDGAPRALEPTDQMAAFLTDLERGRERLAARGVVAGRSRLAVWTGSDARRCRRVGLCLHGCPYGAIWNAAQRLEELTGDAAVTYEPGLLAERVEDLPGGAELTLRALVGGERTRRRAAAVLLACGPVESTRIVLASIGRRSATLHDSQVLAVPLLRARGAAVSVERSGNTLAQAFLELRDAQLSVGTVHVQVYGFNDLMLAEAATMARLPARGAERLLRPLLGRLLFAQAYLHSGESGSVALAREDDETLVLTAQENPATAEAQRRVLRRLLELTPALRAVPLLPMASRGLIGTGNHAGGSFPMRDRPGPGESDLLGRPYGFERVHVVDSSVFPTIPAPTITLSVMANATRIAAAIS